ncbi:hypothetical protein H0V99_02465 [Candidatus Saccharibacteria bacterium]|nr:hypothetical protein [Candidatus Saccharibacteria bacterium]
MFIRLRSDQQGAVHLVISIVLVLTAVGGVGYYVMNKQKKDKAGTEVQSVANKEVEKACKQEIDDQDFCKFASNWSQDDNYKVVMSNTSAEGTSVMTFEIQGKDKSRSVTTMNGAEVAAFVSIGNTSYIKDLSDGAWTKYTSDAPTDANVTDDLDFNFSEDDTDTTTPPDNTEYKKLDKEACGNLTCFKYQIVDPEEPNVTQFIWFDDKDYKLRRMVLTNTEGSSDMIYSYETVNIIEPSPVKEAPDYQNMSAEELQSQLDAAMSQYEDAQ